MSQNNILHCYPFRSGSAPPVQSPGGLDISSITQIRGRRTSPHRTSMTRDILKFFCGLAILTALGLTLMVYLARHFLF
jgi:hypothetical protein